MTHVRIQTQEVPFTLKLMRDGLFLALVLSVGLYCMWVFGMSRVGSDEKHRAQEISEQRVRVATLETEYALRSRALTGELATEQGLVLGTRVFADRASVATAGRTF